VGLAMGCNAIERQCVMVAPCGDVPHRGEGMAAGLPYTDGRLTAEELDERVAAALSARTLEIHGRLSMGRLEVRPPRRWFGR
jgi:Domain of unknown function (DUF1707)